MDIGKSMVKKDCKCALCGKPIKRCEKNAKGEVIKNHFCDRTCKGLWQKQQRENLGYTKEWLYEEYIVKGRDCNDIAKEINRDPKRVWEWMKDYGIETRKRGTVCPENHFKKGQKSAFAGHKHSDKTKELFRQKRLQDGHVPYLKNGQHWLKEEGKHPASWRGGVTPERQALYSSNKWKCAVKEVWKREKGVCQLCGKKQNDDRNAKFHLHHLYPFADYERLRTNPDNLVMLCPDCHRFVHSKKNKEKVFMLKEVVLPKWMKGDKNNGEK